MQVNSHLAVSPHASAAGSRYISRNMMQIKPHLTGDRLYIYITYLHVQYTDSTYKRNSVDSRCTMHRNISYKMQQVLEVTTDEEASAGAG